MTILNRPKAPTVSLRPNIGRIVEAIIYVISEAELTKKDVTQYDIVKTLFLADRAHLNNYGRPITFDQYVAMKHGPVPSIAYDLLKTNIVTMKRYGLSELPWSSASAPQYGQSCSIFSKPMRKPSEDVLSKSDMEELSSALSIVKSLSFHQIRRLTHEDPAYIDAWEEEGNAEAYPMSLGLLFEVPNFEEAENLKFISEHL